MLHVFTSHLTPFACLGYFAFDVLFDCMLSIIVACGPGKGVAGLSSLQHC